MQSLELWYIFQPHWLFLINKHYCLNLQIGRFAVKIRPEYVDKISDESNEYGTESTYEEDAPYLPRTLLEFLEENSVLLGLQNHPTRFDDLQKVKEKELHMIEQDHDNSSSVMTLQRETSMVFNTVRDSNLEMNQRTPLQDVTTGVNRRNSNLVQQTLDGANQSIQNMEIGEVDRGLQAPRHNNTENNSEIDDENRETSGRMELQTDLGINAHASSNQITNPSPMTSNLGINDSLTNSLRDRVGTDSQQSTLNNSEIRVSSLEMIISSFWIWI